MKFRVYLFFSLVLSVSANASCVNYFFSRTSPIFFQKHYEYLSEEEIQELRQAYSGEGDAIILDARFYESHSRSSLDEMDSEAGGWNSSMDQNESSDDNITSFMETNVSF